MSPRKQVPSPVDIGEDKIKAAILCLVAHFKFFLLLMPGVGT
ncbi:hypothetical protein [Pseudomonas lopnurensis]|nr:hypothetical protein [Pseudomonas lopnurensis]